ncbi:DNA-dependent ATPase MGS1 [Nakaseomyces bracarensis]|uniref:DNA-dependent ATPase MGS1 n=1 Tax=Nakaseomyces bracarensis TaxID=273131 RepID=A0ABR4NND7_9SACH
MSGNSKGTEQLISCPVCNEKIQFSLINSHLDGCTSGSATSSGSGGQQKTITSILGSRSLNKKRNISQEEVIDLDNEKDEITPKKPEEKKQKVTNTVVDPSKNADYEFRWLQKIGHLPLSEKLRPKEIRDYVGQQHILSQENGVLNKYVQEGIVPSMILWGPPGVGKTSLARLLTKTASVHGSRYSMIETSATKANTQELRSIFEKGRKEYQLTKRRIVLFIDEIHRFNKVQQDLLLPHVENGDIVLIGATTENPSFQLNNALISRCHVFVLEKLSQTEIIIILSRGVALLNKCRKILWNVQNPLKLPRNVLEYIYDLSVGDARRSLNLLEMIEVSSRAIDEEITIEKLKEIIKNNNSQGLNTYYDPKGDNHYDTISAFHKAVRGSDENASLYYLGRMLQGGEDPLYIARRMIRIASEDIGIRDNSLLPLAVAAHDTVMKLGLPEADMALVQCCVSLARAPKSVEIYRGWKKLKGMLAENKYNLASSEIPMHIRNAPTRLMEELGYHKGYKYNPGYKDGLVKQEYFPQEVLEKCEDKDDLVFLDGQHLGDKIDPELEENFENENSNPLEPNIDKKHDT